ncbi:MAG: UDP-glucose--hexose-1-phosphate uridylyltransferase [Caldicoprobacterales bacterium]|nr:UDP-glucose--hexose-1-phosphate uridylyltransferase [Clostridiales bacterium]
MTYSKKDVAKLIEQLIAYGLENEMIRHEDIFFVRNQLLDLLNIPEPWEGSLDSFKEYIPDTATPILEKILDYAAQEGIIPENTLVYRDLLDTKIMGLITPMPSQVIDRFNSIKETHGIKSATDDFYRLCRKCDYIRVNRIAKNQEWSYESDYGTLRITINLTKPEKDPREIAALKNAPQVGYPQCVLCPENVGYAGRINHPARQNHRTLPLKLAGEQWYFQYSPYVYYNEHCIVLKEEHVPMKISRKTFERLFDFIDQFPHYFIGSNADLPIVGGSILNHDHFQGGSYTFPMEVSPIEYSLTCKDYPQVKAGVLNWPMSTLRLISDSSEVLVELADTILNLWRDYSDAEVDVLSQSADENGQVIPHNTITPIARKNDQGLYELDLVFRNNRTSKEFPLGIFHPHPEIHHIKKENIGLIEVMGLFILPGRLQKELAQIKDILTGQVPLDMETLSAEDHPLHHHGTWIEELVDKYGNQNSDKEAQTIIENAVGAKCEQVLKDAGVFKTDEQGRQAFNKFLATAGFTI